MESVAPELSVIIPTLNESDHLRQLLTDLAAQRGIRLQVLLADGGSTDGSVVLAQAQGEQLGLRFSVVHCLQGRGHQMNAAAHEAKAPALLFLHADSRLPRTDLLATALAAWKEERARSGNERVAAHFGLRFRRSSRALSRAYYFYEAKTCLNRTDCVRGDQGILLCTSHFNDLGGFDESQPYLEDLRFAERVAVDGNWMVLPGKLETSARRFEEEGLIQRQVLNALLCNFERIGMREYFAAARGCYRAHSESEKLDLYPFLEMAHRVAAAQGKRRFLRYWYHTGRHVAINAWQLAFSLDCRANQRDGWAPGKGGFPWLERYQRWFSRLSATALAGVVAALVTATGFYVSLQWLDVCANRRRRKKPVM